MARQIIIGTGSSVPALEHRITVLERQVAELTETTRALVAAMERASLGISEEPSADLERVPASTR